MKKLMLVLCIGSMTFLFACAKRGTAKPLCGPGEVVIECPRCLVADGSQPSEYEMPYFCASFTCDNGIVDNDETDVDCGGSCGDCRNGQKCAYWSDCSSGICAQGKCVEAPPSTVDGGTNLCETTKVCGTTTVNACTSLTNCGFCGNDCTAGTEGAICNSGQCDCPLGWRFCNSGGSNGRKLCLPVSQQCPTIQQNPDGGTAQCPNAAGTRVCPVTSTSFVCVSISDPNYCGAGCVKCVSGQNCVDQGGGNYGCQTTTSSAPCANGARDGNETAI
ncbi:MAG: hypothetical protein AABY13_05325, partial [Nanoarchaeota archaeon]